MLIAVSEFIDPTPLIEERIAAEVGPLREALSHTLDRNGRRRLKREIRRRERRIRLSFLVAPERW
jgi:hypothetical protein